MPDSVTPWANASPASTGMYARRALLQCGVGLGGVALTWLLQRDGAVAAEHTTDSPLAPKPPQLPARAKAMIYFVMEGGPSQIDTFDPKPELHRQAGKVFARGDVKTNQVKGTRYFVESPFQFRQYGQCGHAVSELFQHVGGCADELAIVRSMYCDSDNHPAALFHYNTGLPVQGSPSVGAWMVYGLGTENENLPAFVVLRDGKPFGGTSCWSNGYLPAVYQGTQFRSGKQPVLNLQSAGGLSRGRQQENLRLLEKLNQRHFETRRRHSELESRLASFELAFQMQRTIPAIADFSDEDQRTRDLYGLDQDQTREVGQRCLLARRLVERGVRFVQIWCGGWDSHTHLESGHRNAAAACDRPLAGLLRDLKQRGLLDETVVVWGGEFGRTADTTAAAWDQKTPGRDHNPKAMTMWFAGGGVRPGTLVGATDDFGDAAVERKYHLKDMHNTLLHLMGLDQDLLTYYHAGRFKRLTDTGGELIREILA